MKRTVPALLASLVLAAAPAAHAAPLVWTLVDGLLDDGGAASGSFIYDADTNTFSAINLVTTGGSVLSGGTFQVLLAGDGNAAAFVPDGALTSSPVLQLIFDTPLTNDGTVVLLANPFFPAGSSFEATCEDGACLSAAFGRSFVDGALISSPVPVPAAAWLLGGALGVLPLVRRRRG
ncbi:MAG: VPLPA-CTERM sorting domain-containing protein [Chromatiales bacterium]|jgi:hypothetical protein|nr:VPLPA-CTERM sorting domain-containing protein [Chromatiales bacterium]